MERQRIDVIKPLTLVQVTSEEHDWRGCVCVVEEVKEWGVLAYLPMPAGKGLEVAPIRLEYQSIEPVGQSVMKFNDA